jgi:hypothetical protein
VYARSVFLSTLGVPVATADEALLRVEFSRIANLAAGDFAAVARRVRLLGQWLTVRELVTELRLELLAKQDVSTRAGFACG